MFDSGPDRVQSLAIVSGGGADYLADAAAAGADALLDRRAGRAGDGRSDASPVLHFIAAGHYATETFGVDASASTWRSALACATSFIDVPNPV